MRNTIATDKATLATLGQRITRYRLRRNWTQEDLAIEAGVSKPTVQRIESGASTQTSNFIRILRALNLLENMDLLIPEPAMSPVQQLKFQGKIRQRASRKKLQQSDESWSWGDEA